MTSIIKKILFNDQGMPNHPGRVISFNRIDVLWSLTKGSIRIRVLTFLFIENGSATIRDIAKGIKSTSGRVSHAMVDLVNDGIVSVLRAPGQPVRFVLSERARQKNITQGQSS